jgi:YVTN family beta-propeller protein
LGRIDDDVVVNPTTNRVYVGYDGSNMISVYDGGTNTILASIPVEKMPFAVAVNPTNNYLFVGYRNSINVDVLKGW